MVITNEIDPVTKERVIIISSHPLFREGMARLLGNDVEVAGAVSEWSEARPLIEEQRPQAIIVDHDDADLTETDLAPLLWANADALRVIYVTLAGDKMTIHDRRQVNGVDLADLLKALNYRKGE